MHETRPLVAVVDGELRFCRALGRLLKTHGFDVVMFTHGDEFVAACASRSYDCLLLDLAYSAAAGMQSRVRGRIRGAMLP